MKKMMTISKIFICLIVITMIVDYTTTADVINTKVSLPSSVIGEASYYSYECADQPMANGRKFDPEKRTCASWFYKFGTVLKVESIDTGHATEVVVTDRGPNKRLVKKGRIIDLSKRAFQDICELEKGLTLVRITIKR